MKIPARILISASILVLLFLLVPLSTSQAASSGEVVINEVFYDPSGTDTGLEWIELYNEGSDPLDLGGYELNAVSGDYYIFPSFTLASHTFVVVHWRKEGVDTATDLYTDLGGFDANMGNTTGWVALFDSATHSKNTVVDYVEYGAGGETWESAASSADIWIPDDFVPDVAEGSSIGLKTDGEDNNLSSDWQEFETPTPGSANVDVPGEDPPEEDDDDGEEDSSEEEEEEINYSDQIFLNEIMPNPEGSDTENEYLELYNDGDGDADLEGWKVGDEKSTKIIGDDIKLSSYLIPSSGFLVVYRKDSHIILNNDGDTVKLWNPNDEIVDEISYPEVDEGWVYQRYPDGDSSWSESNQPTVNAANKTSSNSSTSSNDPEVTFLVEGDDFKINQSFNVQVEIKNAKALHDYYVKIRLGLKESKLSKGRTQSSRDEVWLADNSAWKNFPVVYTDSDGGEKITVSAKVASGNPVEAYIIGVRLRDTETGKNFDSETQVLDFGEEEMSNEEDNSDEESSILGATTELPATGGGGGRFVVTNLFVTAISVAAKFILRRKYIAM